MKPLLKLPRGLALLAMSFAASAQTAAPPDAATLAAKAAQVFGAQAGQSFDAQAHAPSVLTLRSESTSLVIAPGKGVELKAEVEAGQGFVYSWRADGELAVDMHGDKPGATDVYTSYAIEGAQRQATGSLIAPFTGRHGWFWRNLGKRPVKLQIRVHGFMGKLARPGH